MKPWASQGIGLTRINLINLSIIILFYTVVAKLSLEYLTRIVINDFDSYLLVGLGGAPEDPRGEISSQLQTLKETFNKDCISLLINH